MGFAVIFLIVVAISVEFCHASFLINRSLARNILATGVFTSKIFFFPDSNVADSTFQDQLRVVKALQLEDQKARVKSINDDSGLKDYQIVKGLVYLLTAQERIDTTEYPFGLPDAASLDPELATSKATLILTAVGKDGPPFAAKRFPLRSLKFPFPFEITTRDLIFPYTKEAWLRSPIAQGSLSVSCILDSDGKLETPSEHDRFGYAISAKINSAGLNAVASGSSESQIFERSDVKINVNFKSDGIDYSESDLDLLRRIDNELDRPLPVSTQ